jgi:hypothetical protein
MGSVLATTVAVAVAVAIVAALRSRPVLPAVVLAAGLIAVAWSRHAV